MNINTSGFVTPAEVYEDAMLRPEPTPQELEEIKGQLLAYDDLMRVSMEKVRSRTHSDLDDVLVKLYQQALNFIQWMFQFKVTKLSSIITTTTAQGRRRRRRGRNNSIRTKSSIYKWN